MKLSKHYKSSEYLFLFSILVLALLLGTYFSFYAFLWRDIKSEVKGFSKDLHMNAMNFQEGIISNGPPPPIPLPRHTNPYHKQPHPKPTPEPPHNQ